MQKISISKFENRDIFLAAQLEKLCFSQPWSVETIKNSLKSGNYSFLAAKLGKEFAGHAGMYEVANEGYVCTVAVHKKFRGVGVGGALVKELLACCKKKNLNFLSLEVRVGNDIAIGLYERCGFKKEGVRKNFYSFPKEDAIIMTHYLK